MIKFAIQVTTENDIILSSEIQEVPSQEVFDAFAEGLCKSIGTGNFKLIDKEGDIIILPSYLINRSVIQIIKVN